MDSCLSAFSTHSGFLISQNHFTCPSQSGLTRLMLPRHEVIRLGWKAIQSALERRDAGGGSAALERDTLVFSGLLHSATLLLI